MQVALCRTRPAPRGSRAAIDVEAQIALALQLASPRKWGYDARERARWTELADELGLVCTGGSDWHGAAEGPRTIGNMRVPYAWLERQDALVQERSASERVA